MRRLLALACLCAPLVAGAQPASNPNDAAGKGAGRAPIAVVNWTEAELRDGLSAYLLLGAEVRDGAGGTLGEVHDILVDAGGRATALIVEGGGFLELGTRQFRVPWTSARQEDRHVVVPGPSAAAGGTREGALVRSGEYRVTDILDDTLEIEQGVLYANVDDVLLDSQGAVTTIVVDADASGPPGRWPAPWARERYSPDPGVARLAYERSQIRHLAPFDYSGLEVPVPQGVVPEK